MKTRSAAPTGEPITRETMQQIIDRADRDKLARAQMRLASAVTRHCDDASTVATQERGGGMAQHRTLIGRNTQ